MGHLGFGLAGVLAILGPAALAAWLAMRWRRDWIGGAVAILAGLLAAWLGLGVFVRLMMTPFLPEGFD